MKTKINNRKPPCYACGDTHDGHPRSQNDCPDKTNAPKPPVHNCSGCYSCERK